MKRYQATHPAIAPLLRIERAQKRQRRPIKETVEQYKARGGIVRTLVDQVGDDRRMVSLRGDHHSTLSHGALWVY